LIGRKSHPPLSEGEHNRKGKSSGENGSKNSYPRALDFEQTPRENRRAQ
jgi:hypothetical protein